jgi:molecular chaperone GrpE (heat shock protein)
MSNITVSMKMSPKATGALYMKIIKQAEKIAELEKENTSLNDQNKRVCTEVAELDKELKETKNIIIAHQTADADGYIDDYGWVANWSEMQARMVNSFKTHNLEQQVKGVSDFRVSGMSLDSDDSMITTRKAARVAELRNQIKALKEQGK